MLPTIYKHLLLPISLGQKIVCTTCKKKKAARKMLIKLTPVWLSSNGISWANKTFPATCLMMEEERLCLE
jgi:hypothetical protein